MEFRRTSADGLTTWSWHNVPRCCSNRKCSGSSYHKRRLQHKLLLDVKTNVLSEIVTTEKGTINWQFEVDGDYMPVSAQPLGRWHYLLPG
jgi:hypothetical protein